MIGKWSKSWWIINGSYQGNKLLGTGKWGIITFCFMDVSLGNNHMPRVRGGIQIVF